PALRIEDVRDLADVAVMPRDDLEDRLRLVLLEGDPPRDLPHLAHAVQDLRPPADLRQLGGGRVQEERRQEPWVLDPVGPTLVPEPEDHRVAVVVAVCIDDPAVHGGLPPETYARRLRALEGPGGRGRVKCAPW